MHSLVITVASQWVLSRPAGERAKAGAAGEVRAEEPAHRAGVTGDTEQGTGPGSGTDEPHVPLDRVSNQAQPEEYARDGRMGEEAPIVGHHARDESPGCGPGRYPDDEEDPEARHPPALWPLVPFDEHRVHQQHGDYDPA